MTPEMPRIKEIWAFLSVDPKDGNEGVCGFMTGAGWVPLVCADQKRVDSLRPVAERIARESGIAVRLARFSVREDLETISQ